MGDYFKGEKNAHGLPGFKKKRERKKTTYIIKINGKKIK